MSHPSTLGSLVPLDADARRDAIHVAIAPFICAPDTYLQPGQPFKLDAKGRAVVVPARADSVGVVDPFLPTSVRPGERFWGAMTPATVSNLRHDWDHAAFPAAAVVPTIQLVEKPEDEEVTTLREFAKSYGLSLTGVMDTASELLNDSCRGCN